MQPYIPAPTVGGVTATLARIPGSWVNVRAQPDGADVGDLRVGDSGTLYPDASQGDWVFFANARVRGWVSRQGGAVQFSVTTAQLRIVGLIACGYVITSKFGVPRDYDGDGVNESIHEGLDMTRSHGDCTPLIRAGVDGTVESVSGDGSYGNHVKVRVVAGGQTYILWYCHLERWFVTAGQRVQSSDYIGVMGSTGNSTGIHLHLNVQKLGALTPPGAVVPSVVDPLPYIQS